MSWLLQQDKGIGEGGGLLQSIIQIIHMIAHGNKQIEKPRMTILHLYLHCPASLENISRANNHSQVMSAQLGIRIRRVVVRIPSRSQDHADRDCTLKTLLTKRKALEIFQTVLLGRAVDKRVSEEHIADPGVENGRLARSVAAGGIRLRVFEFIVKNTGVVIVFVQELENAGHNLRFSVPR